MSNWRFIGKQNNQYLVTDGIRTLHLTGSEFRTFAANAIDYNQQQINRWMNELADHGDSFDERGRYIVSKIKFHVASKKAHLAA